MVGFDGLQHLCRTLPGRKGKDRDDGGCAYRIQVYYALLDAVIDSSMSHYYLCTICDTDTT